MPSRLGGILEERGSERGSERWSRESAETLLARESSLRLVLVPARSISRDSSAKERRDFMGDEFVERGDEACSPSKLVTRPDDEMPEYLRERPGVKGGGEGDRGDWKAVWRPFSR